MGVHMPSKAWSFRGDCSATAGDAGQFSHLELQAIELGESADAAVEISPQSRLGRFLAWTFGTRLALPLADPRLEALRLFASLVRHHCDRVVEADLDRLIAAGFSHGQACGLHAYLRQRCQIAASRLK